MIAQGYTLLLAITGDQGATASTGSNDGVAICGSSLAVEYPGSDPDVVSVGGTALSTSSIDDTFFSEGAWEGDTTKGSCSGNRGGSGGGVSSFWDRPSYQVDSSNSKRTVPDMALNASNGFTQSMYYGGKEGGAFGTSIASPELAGFFAQENAYLLTIGNICGPGHNQACAPMGLANPAIYTLGRCPRFIGYHFFTT